MRCATYTIMRKHFEDDDGRIVADMSALDRPLSGKRRGSSKGGEEGYTPSGFREWMRTIGGSLLAGLLVAGVFVAAGALFILFCTNVWLK